MSDKKISELTTKATPVGADSVPIYDVAGDATKKALLSAIATLVLAGFVDAETPTGTINGTNKEFTLANAPSPATSLILTLNGQVLAPAGEDYTLVTLTITMVNAPLAGPLRAWYRK